MNLTPISISFVIVVSLLLNGCISVNQSAVDYYDFKEPAVDVEYHHIPVSVVIPAHLKQQRVLVKVSDVRYRYLNQAKWLDNLDRRIKHHLSARLSKFKNVKSIRVDLHHFDLTQEGVYLSALITIHADGARKIHAFSTTRAVSGENLEGQIKAASDMVDEMAAEINQLM